MKNDGDVRRLKHRAPRRRTVASGRLNEMGQPLYYSKPWDKASKRLYEAAGGWFEAGKHDEVNPSDDNSLAVLADELAAIDNGG